MRRYWIYLTTAVVILLGCVFFVYNFVLIQKTSIRIEGKEVSASYVVEVADTAEKAQEGLMYRKSMPQNQGMITLCLFRREQKFI